MAKMIKYKSGKKNQRIGYYATKKIQSLSEQQIDNLKQSLCVEACDTLLIVSAVAAKKVFKENATNPKMEQFIEAMMDLLEKVGADKVSLNALSADLEALCKIKYDIASQCWINMKAKQLEDVK